MKKKKLPKKKKKMLNIATILYIIGIVCIIIWLILKVSTPKVINTFIGRQQLYCSDEYYGSCYKVTFTKLVEYITYYNDPEDEDAAEDDPSEYYFIVFERGKTIDKSDIKIKNFTFNKLTTESKYGRIHNYYKIYYLDWFMDK